jgi:glycosyltransferase involved in cell wall biosynthesis
MDHYPNHQWFIDVEEKTNGIISLLPMGIKKKMQLKKYQPDVLISASPDVTIQQLYRQIVFINLQFEFGKKTKMQLDASHVAVTTSATLKKKLVEQNKINSDYIHLIPAAASEDVSVADWSEKLHVKQKYTEGRDFFLCFKAIAENTQWEEILKAFSIFKKWQQSSFKLLVVGSIPPSFEDEFKEKLDSYKYKDDVMVIDPAKEDINRILPSAFGLICGEPDHTGINILNAFKAEVPVISSPLELFDEEVSGAFIPAVASADELSRQIINLYRDERMRDILVQKGKEQVSHYSWEDSAQRWYRIIEELSQ